MTATPAPSACRGRCSLLANGTQTIALCIAISVALHSLLLALRLPVSRPVQQSQGNIGRTEGLRGRVIAASPRPSTPLVLLADTERRVFAKAKISTQHVDPVLLAPSTARQVLPAPEALRPAVEPPTESETVVETSVAPAAASPSRAGDFSDDYVPRPLLSVSPVARAPIILARPPSPSIQGRYVGVLSLFIDERGQVQRIARDEPTLPPAFEQTAREVFMAAQFAPGEIDGVAVKSRLRIEVIFDDASVPER